MKNTAGASPLTRVVDHVERTLAWLLALLMGVMVVDVTWQVVSRFLLHAPSSITEEVAGFLLIWIGLLGAAYGFRTRAHLGIDLLVSSLQGTARRTVTIVAHGLVLAFALSTMVVGGIMLVQLAFQLDQISAAMGIRVGMVYLALPLSGLLIIVFSVESIAKTTAASAAAAEDHG